MADGTVGVCILPSASELLFAYESHPFVRLLRRITRSKVSVPSFYRRADKNGSQGSTELIRLGLGNAVYLVIAAVSDRHETATIASLV